MVIRLHFWFYLTYHTRSNHLFEGFFSCADHQAWSKIGARLHLVFFTTYFGSNVSCFSGILLLDLVQAWAWVPSLSFFKTTIFFFFFGHFHLTNKSYAKVCHFYLLVWLDLKSVLFHNQKLRSSFSFLVLGVEKSFYLSTSTRLYFFLCIFKELTH